METDPGYNLKVEYVISFSFPPVIDLCRDPTPEELSQCIRVGPLAANVSKDVQRVDTVQEPSLNPKPLSNNLLWVS